MLTTSTYCDLCVLHTHTYIESISLELYLNAIVKESFKGVIVILNIVVWCKQREE